MDKISMRIKVIRECTCNCFMQVYRFIGAKLVCICGHVSDINCIGQHLLQIGFQRTKN